MAFCQVCGKTKQYGHNVSHSKRRTKRVFMPNVFRKKMLVIKSKIPASPTGGQNPKSKIPENGEIERIKICSKCLKRAKKYGHIQASADAVLGGVLVRVVDWEQRAKSKEQRAEMAELEQKEKVEKKKEQAEVSVEELVGKKVKGR